MQADLPKLLFESQAHWSAWLRDHHATSQGIWIRLARKNSDTVSVNYSDAVEEALCWGWIDGQKKSDTAHTWLQKFTPRRSKSLWSRINCDRALALIESHRMQPAGLREVEKARADGRWAQAYDPPSSAEVPPEFACLLAANPSAADFFRTVNKANRYAFLYRIQTARKPETRLARMKRFVEMLAEHKLFHP